jgi:hypothetical protein
LQDASLLWFPNFLLGCILASECFVAVLEYFLIPGVLSVYVSPHLSV